MKNMFLFGVCGKMGKAICELNEQSKIFNISGGFDVNKSQTVPTFSDVSKVDSPCDVIVDFSRPETLSSVIALAESLRVPVVIATTGHSEEQLKDIEELSKKVAVFKSGNMSVGINVLIELSKRAAAALANADIEIIEKHHNQKVDAPSGTAKMIADAVAPFRNGGRIVSGRDGKDCKREKDEIGISSIRGGTIVGEHEILFCCNDETITISHSAASRKIFAEGALKAANFILNKQQGMYNMSDLLKGII